MAYRYTATGTLQLLERHVDAVCGILSSNRIGFQRNQTTVTIDHEDRAATQAGPNAKPITPPVVKTSQAK